MKIVKPLFFLLITFCVMSCSGLGDITIDDVQQGRVKQQVGKKVTIEVKVKVNNPSSHKVTLRNIKAEILRNGYQFADLRLKEKVKVLAHSNEYHSVLIEFDLIDYMAVISNSVDLTQLDENFTATGFVKVGTGLLSKKFKFVDKPMDNLWDFSY